MKNFFLSHKNPISVILAVVIVGGIIGENAIFNFRQFRTNLLIIFPTLLHILYRKEGNLQLIND